MGEQIGVDVLPEVVCATWLKAWETQSWGKMAMITRTHERMGESQITRGLQQTLGKYHLLLPNDVHLEVISRTPTTIEYMVKQASLSLVIVNFKISVVRERGLWFVDPATLKARDSNG